MTPPKKPTLVSDNLSSPDKLAASLCVGVVGLGHMGSAFAQNLVDSGYKTFVFDRNESKRNACAGAKPASVLADLSVCDVVFSSLPDDTVLSNLSEGSNGLVSVLKEGAVHVSTSTVSPAISRHLSQLHEMNGQGYVASPVLGNPDLAKARKVFFMVAGASGPLSKAAPVIESLGQHVFFMGDDPGHANLMKLAANVMIATTLESMGETLALLRKGGIPAEVGFDVLTNSLFDSKVHKAYGGKILREQYRPAGMVVPLALKDMRLALLEAERSTTPMPFASLVRDRMVAMLARGWDTLDWSALGLLASQDARLPSAQELSDVLK
ncbi:MAG: NAD(P)-dependent oxidoreductase [Gluconobacter potus]|uniref:NAD(P)-dependent oxidoreductase n=1 Tax=Gluconobacter potus TaxID=2724927 RepID=UPI0039EB827B